MGDEQKKPSTSWAISSGLSVGAGKSSVISGQLALTLFDVDAQIYFPMSLELYGLGEGIPFGITVSTFSPTFFTTTKPLWVKDFSVGGFFANAELVVLIGGGLAYLTFRGIHHDPYWLDVGGVGAGLSAGVSGAIFSATAFDKNGKANDGCIITRNGVDPYCGGSSKEEPRSSSASTSPQSKSSSN